MIDNKESSRGVNDLKTRAITALQEGKLAEAEALLKSAWEICRNEKEKAKRVHDLDSVKEEEAELLHGLGDLAVRQGNLDLAKQYLADALAKYRTLNNRLKEAHILLYLGRIAVLTDDDIQPLWDALQSYQEVDNKFDRQRGVANVHQALGDHAQQRSDYPSAEEHYRTALSIYRGINYHRGQAHALSALGRLAQLRGDFAGAEQYYQEGLASYRQVGDPSGEVNTLRALADLATSRRDLLTAARYLREAFALCLKTENRAGKANVLMSLGTLEMSIEKPDSAQQRFCEALEIYRASNHRIGTLNALHRLAEAALLTGHLTNARTNCQEALRIAQTVGDRLGEANANRILASLDLREGKLDSAETNCRAAIEAYRAIGHRLGEGNALMIFCALAIKRDDLNGARQHYEAAASTFNTAGLQIAKSYALLDLVKLVSDRDLRSMTTYERLQEALTICQTIGHPDAIAVVSLALSEVALGERDFEGAHKHGTEALRAYQATGDLNGQVRALINLGYAAIGKGDLDEAGGHAHAAMSLARHAHDVHLLSGIIALHAGELKQAHAHFLAAQDAFKEINDQMGIAQTTQILTKLETQGTQAQDLFNDILSAHGAYWHQPSVHCEIEALEQEMSRSGGLAVSFT